MFPRNTSTGRIRGTTPGVETAARELRAQRTAAEQVLWEALRRRRLNGLRFRCQHPAGPFVLDFCCPAHKLVVEVDGGVHDSQLEQDGYRTAHLEAYGYRVLRFRNEEVLTNLALVLERIAQTALDLPSNAEGAQPARGNGFPSKPRAMQDS
jgi:very-short-patch-repair endonuclease